MNAGIRVLSVIFMFVLSSMIYSCIDNEKSGNSDDVIVDKNNRVITAEIIEVENGWGYDIYIDGKRTIRQSHIPAVEGLQTFETKNDASKVADLVKYKLDNGIMPPSITTKELDSLEIVKK